MATLPDVRRQSFRSLIPALRLLLSTWIEKEIRLPESMSALPGPIRLAPYMVEVADCIGDGEHERVTVCKCVRIGYTLVLTCAIAANVHNRPRSMLVLLPTEADVRDFIVSDLEPLFDAIPVVKGALRPGTRTADTRSAIVSSRARLSSSSPARRPGITDGIASP